MNILHIVRPNDIKPFLDKNCIKQMQTFFDKEENYLKLSNVKKISVTMRFDELFIEAHLASPNQFSLEVSFLYPTSTSRLPVLPSGYWYGQN